MVTPYAPAPRATHCRGIAAYSVAAFRIVEHMLYYASPRVANRKAAMTLYRELRECGAEDTRALVDVERTGERAIITMNEPERLNPLSVGLNLQLQEHLL